MERLQVRMLGEFTLTSGENKITDTGSRTKKAWSLLAYLICQRGRVVSQKKLIDLLWGDTENSNPENTLRITLHRTRALLDGLWEGAGHELILHREGGYTWNTDISIRVDCDIFDQLCQAASQSDEDRMQHLLEALALYKGDFLEKQASETWVIPISTHFHNLYLSVSMEAAGLLSSLERHREAAAICKSAAVTEPYHEPLHQVLIRELAATGDKKAAAAVYDSLSKRLFDDFGIRPSEQTRSIYRNCVHSPNDRTLPIDEVLEQLQEPESMVGALQCDYDQFKILCYAESRSMERNGNATHILLFSFSSDADKTLTRRSTDRIMEQFGEQIRLNLRRGDIFSRCSVTQYIVMLPKANYENSCMVCRRILGAFNRAHPHVTAKIHYMVQPLTPSTCVP